MGSEMCIRDSFLSNDPSATLPILMKAWFDVMVRCGFNLWSGEMLVESKSFAKSGRGPCNRRMNYFESLLNDWQDVPDDAELRKFLQHALRLTAVVLCASWHEDLHNCHEWVDPALACPSDSLPRGVFTDREAGNFIAVKTRESYRGWFLETRIKMLPDFDPLRPSWEGFPS